MAATLPPVPTSIQARRFASDGSGIGQDFQINNDTTGYQLAPSPAVSQDGSFVVTWHSSASDFSDQDGYSVQGRRFAAHATPAGPQFQVNSSTLSERLIVFDQLHRADAAAAASPECFETALLSRVGPMQWAVSACRISTQSFGS